MLHWAHGIGPACPEISTPVSLVVIVVVLAVTTVASLIKTRRDPAAKAHAGSLRAQQPRRDRRRTDRTALKARTAPAAWPGRFFILSSARRAASAIIAGP